MTVPAKFDMKGAVPLDSGAPAKFDMSSAVPLDAPDFSQNPQGEGLYKMKGKDGKITPVPYSKVGDAFKLGYRLTPEDSTTYLKHAAADPELKRIKGAPATSGGKTLDTGVTATGRNTAGQPTYGAEETPGALSRFAESEYDAILGAAKGIAHAADWRPTEEEKAVAARSGPVANAYDTVMRYPERIVKPNVDMAAQAGKDFDAKDYPAAAKHAIGAVIPIVGPWMQQTADTMMEQAGAGNYAGAAGTGVGNAIVAEGPKVVGDVAKATLKHVPAVAKAGVEAVTKTSPRELKKMAQETYKANQDAIAKAKEENAAKAETHTGDIHNALDKTRQIEDLHERAQDVAQDKANADTEAANEKERLRVNDENLKKITKDGEDRLKVAAKNRANIKDYEKTVAKIKEENLTNYRREQQRQKLETDAHEASKRLDTKFKAAFNKARSAYNAQWNSWRDAVKDVVADMTPVVATIEDQRRTMNPESVGIFNDIMKETKPDPEDVGEVERIRDELVKEHGYTKKYPQLSPHERADIDAAMAEQDLGSLSDSDLKSVPASRLHGWKSQLEVAVRSVKDGHARYAIGKVLAQVRKLEENVSKSVPGAEARLLKARALTGPYFEAFFKSTKDLPPEAGQSLREQTPEYVKEKAEAERLARIAAYDPSIMSASAHLDNLQQGLADLSKDMGSDKSRDYKQLPEPPTLAPKPQPTPLEEHVPKEAPKVELPPPDRVAPPDRPVEQVPQAQWEKYKEDYRKANNGQEVTPDVAVPVDEKTISPEDYVDRKKGNIRDTADMFRERGVQRALRSLTFTLPLSLMSAVLGHPLAAAVEIGSSPMILAGSHKLAALLEKPEVVSWLSNVTDNDVEQFNSLPEHEKALFTENMRNLASEAQKKNIPISPAMAAFIALAQKYGELAVGTAGGSEKKEDTPAAPPTDDATPPEGHASAKPAHTHVYSEETGTIVPV